MQQSYDSVSLYHVFPSQRKSLSRMLLWKYVKENVEKNTSQNRIRLLRRFSKILRCEYFQQLSDSVLQKQIKSFTIYLHCRCYVN